MIVRFFKSGVSSGEGPVRYVLSVRDHQGNLRPEMPELLAGSPQLTIDLINGISRKHKYSSGCLAFRPGEQPTRADLFRILDRFKEVVAPGLSPDQFNGLFVLHNEPPDRKTGQCGFHVHFIFPMTLLAGTTATGKSLTGARWNPHPPGRRTIETMDLFTKVTNHENGWAQVMPNPSRVGLDSFWRKADQTNLHQKAQMLRREVVKAIQARTVNSRGELLTYLDRDLGLTVTRAAESSVSVKFPGSLKAVRLRDPIFEARTDFPKLRSQLSKSREAALSPQADYQQAVSRLASLCRERAIEISNGGRLPGRPGPTMKRTRKETSDGGLKERIGRGQSRPQDFGRLLPLPVAESRLERNLFSAGPGQRRHDDDGGHKASSEGPSAPSGSSQGAVNASQELAGARRSRLISGPSLIVPGLDINEKIRAVAIELNQCELGSTEAQVLIDQLAVLQGLRAQQAVESPYKARRGPPM